MKVKSIQNSLPIVATTLCSRFGVEILLAGEEAFTDGQRIVLPNILDSRLDPTIIYGYLLHECGHIRLTDFASIHRIQTPLHHALSNILEDGRIERGMCSLYAGGQHWINTLHAYCIRDPKSMGNPSNYSTPKDKAFEALLQYVFLWTRIHAVGQGVYFGNGLPFVEKEFVRHFGQELFQGIQPILDKSLQARSFSVIVDIAKEIIDLFKNQNQEPQSDSQKDDDSGKSQTQENKQDGKQSDSGAAGSLVAPVAPENGSDDSSSPSGEEKDSADNSEASSGSSGSQKKPEKSSDSDGNKASGSGAAFSLDPSSHEVEELLNQMDASKAVQDALTGDAKGRNHEQSSLPPTHIPSLLQGLNEGVPTKRLIPLGVAERNVIEDSKRMARSLERMLRTKIEAHNRTGYVHTHSGNSLNSRRLASFVTGNTKVFTRKIEKKAVNTAIDIMLDMSGSMDYRNVHLAAKKAAIAFASATYRINGVDVGICTFSGHSKHHVTVVSHLPHKGRLTDQVIRDLARFAPNGGTPSSDAVIASAYRLMQCKTQTRRILFFITDGDVKMARDHIKAMKAANIETRGLFLTEESLPNVFDREVGVSPSAGSEIITKAILDLMSESVLP